MNLFFFRMSKVQERVPWQDRTKSYEKYRRNKTKRAILAKLGVADVSRSEDSRCSISIEHFVVLLSTERSVVCYGRTHVMYLMIVTGLHNEQFF